MLELVLGVSVLLFIWIRLLMTGDGCGWIRKSGLAIRPFDKILMGKIRTLKSSHNFATTEVRNFLNKTRAQFNYLEYGIFEQVRHSVSANRKFDSSGCIYVDKNALSKINVKMAYFY